MYSVLNTLSEYTYFCISKNITSYTFLLVFKIVESLQCIFKNVVDLEKKYRQEMKEKLKLSLKKMIQSVNLHPLKRRGEEGGTYF